MNKLINRLNPKTTNFDSVGGGSGVGAITAADVCIALSYAKLDDISSQLIRFKCLNEATVQSVKAFSFKLMARFAAKFDGVDLEPDVLRGCAIAALIEFCLVPAHYKPSGRNRALLIGVSEPAYRRHNLKHWVDTIANEILSLYSTAEARISEQFASLKSMSN